MTNEKKLEHLKKLVKDIFEKVSNSAHVVDLTLKVEDLARALDLDVTFDSNEVKHLKKMGYKLSRDNITGSKKFKYKINKRLINILVTVGKFDFEDYYLNFNSVRGNEMEEFTGELSDVSSKSEFFKSIFSMYREGIS